MQTGCMSIRGRSMSEAVTLDEKFGMFSDHFAPLTVASVNGHDIRVVKMHGENAWHCHADDEAFLCWSGECRVEFRDRTVPMVPGQVYVIPRGVEHRAVSDRESELIMISPSVMTGPCDAIPVIARDRSA